MTFVVFLPAPDFEAAVFFAAVDFVPAGLVFFVLFAAPRDLDAEVFFTADRVDDFDDVRADFLATVFFFVDGFELAGFPVLDFFDVDFGLVRPAGFIAEVAFRTAVFFAAVFFADARFTAAFLAADFFGVVFFAAVIFGVLFDFALLDFDLEAVLPLVTLVDFDAAVRPPFLTVFFVAISTPCAKVFVSRYDSPHANRNLFVVHVEGFDHLSVGMDSLF